MERADIPETRQRAEQVLSQQALCKGPTLMLGGGERVGVGTAGSGIGTRVVSWLKPCGSLWTFLLPNYHSTSRCQNSVDAIADNHKEHLEKCCNLLRCFCQGNRWFRAKAKMSKGCSFQPAYCSATCSCER